jgi:hypothetical protein
VGDTSPRQTPGPQRARILSCLGGDNPRLPGYFARPEGVSLTGAYRDHVARLSRDWSAQTDPIVVSLLAAARLLTGDLTAASIILDHLPAEAAKLKYGPAHCPLAPMRTLNAVLPLPPDLRDTGLWLAGSTVQTALRAWLAANGDSLRWVEAEEVYRRVP